MIDAPNLLKIQKCLTGNTLFEDDQVEIVLNANAQPEDDSFEISLLATKKLDLKSIRIETRVALEKHVEGRGHVHPHLQIDNFASDEELLGKGKLHILLLVETKDELERCCEGFAFILGKIMDVIEDIFDVDSNLKEYFFYLEPLQALEPNQKVLQDLILRSFQRSKIVFENDGLNLIEYKGRKSDPPLDTQNIFKILRISLYLKVLNPLLLRPIYQLISKDGQISAKCEPFTFEEFYTAVTNMPLARVKHYARGAFIEDFSRR